MSEGVELLEQLRDPETYCYADDLKLIAIGQNENVAAGRMQTALNILVEWTKKNNLQFNVDKTKALLFTRKNRYNRPELKIGDKTIEYVHEFKYLGVTFDQKLKWNQHVETQVKKAKITLMTARSMIGKTWGLTPAISAWIYTAIVRPIITYGAVAWINAINTEKNRKKLRKVHRLALKMMTGSMHSTPTAGMEVITNIRPVDIFIKQVAIATSIRLEKTGNWPKTNIHRFGERSHIRIIEGYRQEIPEVLYPKDKSWMKIRTEPRYNVQIKSRKELNETVIRPTPYDEKRINVWTDGSKTESGAGSAYYIRNQEVKEQEYLHLGNNSTVFQAEITAITRATIKLLELEVRDKEIHYYVDNQGALKSMRTLTNEKKTVSECKRTLNKLTEYNNEVQLNWIPAHSFHLGNEIADRLAKRGANTPDIGPEPRIPISEQSLNTHIKKWGKAEHDRTWNNKTDCRQSRLVLPSVSHSWKILRYERRHVRVLTQLVTGHANLKRHRYLMKMEEDPLCDMCKVEETALHLMTNCARYSVIRAAILGNPAISESNIRNYKVSKILRFAKETGRWTME